MRRFPKAILLSVLAALVCLPRPGETCGPLFSEAIFARPHGPDRPLEDFARGKLGVVLPDWNIPYRVVAYRYLVARPLSATEQESLLDHYNVERRIEPPDWTGRAVQDWTSARSKYRQEPPLIALWGYKPSDSEFFSYPNCLAPAFTTAIATLNDRANRFGPASRDLQEWISGQDAVFSNCGGGNGSSFPPELPDTANPLLRADRAYQIAAAHFYAGGRENYEIAVTGFQAISVDKSSPWHTLSSYLVARSLIRQASVAAEPDQTYYLPILSKAEAQLEAILKDPELQSVHDDALALLGLVRYRLHPEQREIELGKLLAEGAGIHFGQDLVDYTWLWSRYPYPAHAHDDLSAWLCEGGSLEGAFEKWRTTHSMPWLVASLWQLKPADHAFKEVMDAAAKVPPTSEAYPTVAYCRARLARESGDEAIARQVLNAVLTQRKALPLSALHLLQDEQMQVVTDYGTFQSRLWQNPIEYDDGVNIVPCDTADAPGCGPQFSAAAAALLNTRIPNELFARIAQSRTFPTDLHRRMAPSAWARAALLDQAHLARQLEKDAGEAEPALKPYLQSYSQAQTPEARKFAAVFAILHFPGLGPYVDGPYPRLTPFQEIDSFHDNWWREDVGSSHGGWVTIDPNVLSIGFPAVLNSAQKQRAAAEQAELRALGGASHYLPRVVLDWGKKHVADPRVPEALHLAVRAMRYGSSNEWSREAFTLLHKNYPNSEWAKQTPYWFK